MDWLQQAVAAGYKNVAHMQKDTDLASLRAREDFKKLMAELEAKTVPKPYSAWPAYFCAKALRGNDL
jgi:NAD(P)H-dependent FMN reductase